MHPGSKNRLTSHSAHLFDGDGLFPKIGRAVCDAGCLPRKELFEAWEVARRVRRRAKGGRVVDMACGHALLAHVMLIIDDRSERALAHDIKLPPSAQKLQRALVAVWPRLKDRVELVESKAPPALLAGDVVVSCHACGALTDGVLDQAIEARAFVAVLPCCQSKAKCDAGALTGWLDHALAVDVTRAARLRAAGYDVWTQSIPATVSPKNRLLIGAPLTSMHRGALS